MTRTIGIDLGTSGVKAVILQDAETVLAEASHPITISIPHIGWSEQNADDWVAAVWSCLDQLTATAPQPMSAVAAIGLSGQMLCALLLDPAHKPLRPAILWNDQRSIAECADLLVRCPDIGQRTNGTPDPGITAPKLLWLARHEPQVMRDARMLLLTKDYVRLALTGDLASEPSDAGGTQLMDCRTGLWDHQLCEIAGWNPDHLPPLTQPWLAAGGLRPALAHRWGLKPGIPVAAGAGDNMAATLGAGAARPGDAVVTLGTSSVTCIVDAAFHPGPQHALLTSAHAAPDTFLSMGVVMSATAALDWTARLSGTTAAALATEAAALTTPKQAASPVFLPCLNGIRTPANLPTATARIEGLHPGVDRAMLGYATMEGVAFQIADCITAQHAVGARPRRFIAVGGGTRSTLWTTLIATAIGAPVALPARSDIGGPAGAARLAAVAAGAPLDVLSAPLPIRATIDPDPALGDILAPRKARFDALVQNARHG